MSDVAIFYETSEGHTAEVAKRMKEAIEKLGHSATVERCREADSSKIIQAKAVIIGGSIHAGSFQKQLIRFIKENVDELNKKPGAFFSINLYSRSEKEERKTEVQGYLEIPSKEAGWKPTIKRTFAGALPYTKYNFVIRWIMKWISSGEGGDTDTSKDFVYTDWNEVDEFCKELVSLIGASSD